MNTQTSVLQCSTFLGLAPYYDKKEERFIKSLEFLVSSTCIKCLIFVGAYYKLFDLVANYDVYAYAKSLRFYYCLYIFQGLLLTASLVGTSFQLMRGGIQKYQELFETLDAMDRALMKNHNRKVKMGKQRLLLVLSLFALPPEIIRLAVDFTWQNVPHHLCLAFLYYLLYFQFILQIHVLDVILKKFELMDSVMSRLQLQQDEDVVESLIELYHKLDFAVDCYNGVFGMGMLLELIAVFVNMIRIIFSFTHSSVDVNTYSIYMDLVASLIFVVLLSKKGEAILDRSVLANYHVSLGLNDSHDEKLSLLLTRLSAQEPRITAAGYFDVNHTFLLLLVNLLATHAVVVVQLNQLT